MSKRKFNLAKVVWLILLCLGIAFFSANNSQALSTPYPIELVDAKISWGGVTANGWYTEYYLHTAEFGVLDAFCVENVTASTNALYELVDVPDDLTAVAKIASLYYDGSVLGLPSIDASEAKSATQIAIWLELGFFLNYNGELSTEVAAIRALSRNDILDSIYLATSPRSTGGNNIDSQDYLVSVPDASIMFLLGSALLGLGLFGRKRKSDV